MRTNDPVHVLVWNSMGCITVSAASAAVVLPLMAHRAFWGVVPTTSPIKREPPKRLQLATAHQTLSARILRRRVRCSKEAAPPFPVSCDIDLDTSGQVAVMQTRLHA